MDSISEAVPPEIQSIIMAGEEIKVAILGCGFLGTALLQGFLRNQNQASRGPSYKFSACVRSESSLQRLKDTLGEQVEQIETGIGPEALQRQAKNVDVVLLGCAPGDLQALIATNEFHEAIKDTVIVSLLAGVSHNQLVQELDLDDARSGNIVRVLPTLGAVIGESVTLIADSAKYPTHNDTRSVVDALFERIGTVQHISETIMAEATALGAVCHALSIVAVDTLADAGAADGIPRDLALQLSHSCLRSASSMFANGWTTSSMKNAMAIPTGITINSILELEKQARPGIAGSARAAVAYTRGMSK